MKKVVLITGASGGIGSALCKAFEADGYAVAANYFKSKMPKGFQADISDREQAEKLCADVIKKFGKIDVLVNNAGVSQSKLFTEITEAELKEMFGINTFGAFFVTQQAVKDMLKRKSGAIINISSIWGKCGGAMETHYSASKAALDGLTKALAKELGPSGITVNSLACGLIDTKMNADLSEADIKAFTEKLPVARIGMPEEVADFAVFLTKCNYVTGQVISIDGGYSLA